MNSTYILFFILGLGAFIYTVYRLLLPTSEKKNIEHYEYENKLQKESSYSYHIGDIDKTINITKKTVENNPKDHVSRFILGKLYLDKKNFINAVEQFELVKNVNVKHIPTREKLAEAYIGMNNFHKAEEELNYILNNKPDSIPTLKMLAYIYEKGKNLSGCINVYKRILKKDNSRQLREKLAHLCALNGEFNRAITEYEQLYKEENDLEFVKKLAELYTKTQRYDSAAMMLQEIINNDENDTNTIKQLAHLYKDMQKYDEALELFKSITPLTAPEEKSLNESIASIYIEMNEPDSVIEICAKLLNDYPNDEKIKLIIAQAYELKKEFQTSIDIVKDVICSSTDEKKTEKLNNHMSTILSKWAVNLFEEDKYQEAFDKFLAALQYNDKNPDIYYNLAKTNHKIRNYEESISHYKRALQITPDNSELYVGLGKVYKDMENTKMALTHLERAIELDNNNDHAYSTMAKLYLSQNMYDKAITFFKKALEIDPYATEDRILLAESYTSIEEVDSSIKEYQKVLSQRPNHPVATQKLKLLTEAEQI